jgi:tRNA nucleotidyltransferase (CCA-adding enzyme)
VQALGAKPGPWTGKVLADVVRWQLTHPAGTKGQCVEWVRAEGAANRWAENIAQTQRVSTAKRAMVDGEVAVKKNKR